MREGTRHGVGSVAKQGHFVLSLPEVPDCIRIARRAVREEELIRVSSGDGAGEHLGTTRRGNQRILASSGKQRVRTSASEQNIISPSSRANQGLGSGASDENIPGP